MSPTRVSEGRTVGHRRRTPPGLEKTDGKVGEVGDPGTPSYIRRPQPPTETTSPTSRPPCPSTQQPKRTWCGGLPLWEDCAPSLDAKSHARSRVRSHRGRTGRTGEVYSDGVTPPKKDVKVPPNKDFRLPSGAWGPQERPPPFTFCASETPFFPAVRRRAPNGHLDPVRRTVRTVLLTPSTTDLLSRPRVRGEKSNQNVISLSSWVSRTETVGSEVTEGFPFWCAPCIRVCVRRGVRKITSYAHDVW